MEDNIENTSKITNDTMHSVRVSTLKVTDFVKGFKFRYRGKPKCWLIGDVVINVSSRLMWSTFCV